MENPNPKFPKMNDGLSRRSIADLADKQLSEILVRLPCYKTVIRCKFVSKRWLSLLSNPKFVIEFVNHKRKKQRQKLLPWTFFPLRQVKLMKDDDNKSTVDESFIDTHNKVFYSSPKFCMDFLRGSFEIVDTFKDLILCIDVVDYKYHYISNPVTKRWVGLPPIPVSLTQHRFWSCLICEDPFNNNNNNIDDYKFRVVVVPFPTDYKSILPKSPFITLKVFVFCSENCEWIDIDVRFPLHTLGTPCYAHPRYPDEFVKKGVVCKGMVCFCYDVYFGMFDPFKMTARARGTTIEARFLPIPYYLRKTKLVEWDGRLVSFEVIPLSPVCHFDKQGNLLVDYEAGISVAIAYQVLNLNQVINNNEVEVEVEVCWTDRGRIVCIDKTGRSRSILSGVRSFHLHPTNSSLIYVLTKGNEVVLCDTRSSTFNTLARFEVSEDDDLPSYNHIRLELQHWPTPLPTIPGPILAN